LTLNKKIWIALVEGLVSKGFLDLPRSRSLAEHLVEELITLVKRTVTGPVTWTLILAEEIVLPASFLAVKEVELLPGGQYTVVRRENCIELWNVEAQTPLWTRTSESNTYCAVEMLNGGCSVVICLSTMCVLESLSPFSCPQLGVDAI
jgi:hypothetical protein